MRWGPDTCGDDFIARNLNCQLEHHFEGVVDVFDFTVRICPNHQAIGLVSGQAHWDWVIDENLRKNGVGNIVRAERSDFDPNPSPGGHYRWSYDALRVLLTVAFEGISIPPPAKARIQAACDLQFGPGRVLVT